MTANELVLTFGDLHLSVQFGENRQRNATVRVTTHGQTNKHTHTHTQPHKVSHYQPHFHIVTLHTHRRTDRQAQTDFIICCMLYAIATGQIKIYETELNAIFR